MASPEKMPSGKRRTSVPAARNIEPAQHARQPERDDDHGHDWRTDHAPQHEALDEQLRLAAATINVRTNAIGKGTPGRGQRPPE